MTIPCQCLDCLWQREGEPAHRRIMALILGQARAEVAQKPTTGASAPSPEKP